MRSYGVACKCVNEFGFHRNGARTKFETNLLIKIVRCDFIYFVCVATNCEQEKHTRPVNILYVVNRDTVSALGANGFCIQFEHLFTRYFILSHSGRQCRCNTLWFVVRLFLVPNVIYAVKWLMLVARHSSLPHFNWLWSINYPLRERLQSLRRQKQNSPARRCLQNVTKSSEPCSKRALCMQLTVVLKSIAIVCRMHQRECVQEENECTLHGCSING